MRKYVPSNPTRVVVLIACLNRPPITYLLQCAGYITTLVLCILPGEWKKPDGPARYEPPLN